MNDIVRKIDMIAILLNTHKETVRLILDNELNMKKQEWSRTQE